MKRAEAYGIVIADLEREAARAAERCEALRAIVAGLQRIIVPVENVEATRALPRPEPCTKALPAPKAAAPTRAAHRKIDPEVVRAGYAAGQSTAAIAAQLGVSTAGVHLVAKRLGIARSRGWRPAPPNPPAAPPAAARSGRAHQEPVLMPAGGAARPTIVQQTGSRPHPSPGAGADAGADRAAIAAHLDAKGVTRRPTVALAETTAAVPPEAGRVLRRRAEDQAAADAAEAKARALRGRPLAALRQGAGA